MDNNDFLTAIEKGKERLTDANRSREDYWFTGSMVLLEACLVEVWNTAKKDTIPIEWVKKYRNQFETTDDYYNVIDYMLRLWEKENG